MSGSPVRRADVEDAGRRLPGRPGRGGHVRRPPGDVGGPHVLHPGRRRGVGPIAAGAAVRAAAQGAPGGGLADRDRPGPAQPRLPGGLPALSRRGRRPPPPGVPRAVQCALRRARLRPDRDPPAVVGAGQGGRPGRADSRAADEDDDRGRARSVGRRHRPSPARQPRPQGVERRAVRRADHPVPPRRARRPAAQDQPGPLGRAGRRVGVGAAPAGRHPHRLHRPDAAVAASLDDGAGRRRAA